MKIFCKNCGAEIEDGALFCSSCGQRVEIPAPEYSEVTEEQPVIAAEQPELISADVYKPRSMALIEEKPKTFFGKGALALCLVVIAILSASTGMFAYLYFSLVNALSSIG